MLSLLIPTAPGLVVILTILYDPKQHTTNPNSCIMTTAESGIASSVLYVAIYSVKSVES